MDDFIVILLILAGIVLHGLFLYLIIRWSMKMKRQMWNQRQQIVLLMKIAEKLGVSEKETKAIEEKFTISDQYLN